jgi:hypothetical protein
MNPLTADRYDVAAEVASVLGWPVVVPGDDPDPTAGGTVYRDPPPGLVTPCAIVAPAAGILTEVAHGPTYSAPVAVWVFAAGLDLPGLEDVLWKLLGAFPGAEAESPGRLDWGGTSYLGTTVTLARHVADPTP